MKHRSVVTLLVIFVVMVVAVLVFVLPALNGRNAHFKANKLFNEGVVCEFNNDYACAIDRYQQAISIYGQDSHYYIYLAELQVKQGNYSDAIKNYQLAKGIDPSNEIVLPELNKAISQQATQTALYLPLLGEATPTIENAGKTSAPPTPLSEAIYPIFDEEFGIIKGIATVSESSDDNIKFEIVNGEAYSGNRSLLITWNKDYRHWASLVLGFDSGNDPKKAAAGQMTSINLLPPADFAIQFFAKRARPFQSMLGSTLMDGSITLKFQDQNVLIRESLGNQAVYIYNYDANNLIPDGRLRLAETGWQEFCLPLAKFDTDYWIKDDKYANYPETDRRFDWSNVKQINIDADWFSTDGAVYIDAIRIIRASDCIPYP